MRKHNQLLKMLLLTIVCILLLSSCSGTSKSSNVKIDALASAFSEWTFEKTQTDSGYSFKYEESSYTLNIYCSGIADKNENVSSVTITNDNVQTSILTDSSQLSKTMNKSADQLTRNDLRAMHCVLEVWNLMDCFGRDTSSLKTSEAISEVSSLFNGKTITIGQWTISAKVNQSSEQVVINANYN